MSESLLSQGTETQPQEAQNGQITDAVTQTQQKTDRPEWLPEKYNSPEDLAKGYKELQNKFGAKEEDLRNKLLEELQAEAFKDRPASAGEYALPDYVDSNEVADNPLLKWWADHSFENGYSQEEFESGIKTYMESLPAPVDLSVEVKKLGDGANQRIEAASMFANKFFPKETLPAIERLCESAEGIIALEVIMEAMKDGSFSGQANPASGLSEADLKEMMRDERYWNPSKRDNDFIKKVDSGFKKLYG